MNIQTETAAPTEIGNGGDISQAVTAEEYRAFTSAATDIAASVIALRFGLSPSVAELVCELARIGGRLA